MSPGTFGIVEEAQPPPQCQHLRVGEGDRQQHYVADRQLRVALNMLHRAQCAAQPRFAAKDGRGALQSLAAQTRAA